MDTPIPETPEFPLFWLVGYLLIGTLVQYCFLKVHYYVEAFGHPYQREEVTGSDMVAMWFVLAVPWPVFTIFCLLAECLAAAGLKGTEYWHNRKVNKA